ncbi:MAG: nucleotide sugar dehydrogenase [Gemmataceae bacterium]
MSPRVRRRDPAARPGKPHLRLLHDAPELEGRAQADRLLGKIADRSARIGVVGLGYVGLPFAVESAKAGFRVLGIDQNLERAKKVNCGENYITDVQDDELADMVKQGRLEAVSDFSDVPKLDALILAIPTPLTRNLQPDLSCVVDATRELAGQLRPGQFICLESTTFPGTTRDVMLPILEENGLRAERDFFLAHSPERVDPGNPRFNTRNTTKIVGGVGPLSQEIAVAVYAQTIEKVVAVSSAETAELVKVFENTFRAVNIALVNELTLLCDRMDMSVWEVLDAAFTKPFGIMPFYPGPGVGGHCIPLDPHYLEWKAREYNFNTRFISLAGEINRRMPEFVREKARRILNERGIALSRARILALGVAYKKNVGDCRESPALEVLRLLREEGADVVYHDPHVPFIDELDLESKPLSEELLRDASLTMIVTDHAGVDYAWVAQHAAHVLDTRNATRGLAVAPGKVTLL